MKAQSAFVTLFRQHLCVLFSVVLLLPAGASGQTIRGRLIQEVDSRPVAGGFVVLVDSTAREVGRALTNSNGVFELRAPRPGRYRLRSALIGWRATLSPWFTLERAGDLEYTFVVRVDPVRLDSVVVVGEQRCGARTDANTAVVDVWEEARKALEALSWTRNTDRFRFRWIRYERTMDPLSLRVLDETWVEERGTFLRGPFETVSPESLWSEGFVRRARGREWIFEAPDADALLSSQFADLHCFAVTVEEEDESLIGLAFRPVEGRNVPEIAGTLWVDRFSGELRHLDFQFVQLPWDVSDHNGGGRVEFQRLPTGSWAITKWWLRMPVVEVLFPSGGARVRRLEEEGASVSAVLDPSGASVAFGAPATLTGVAFDSLRSIPFSGAELSLLGTSYRTRTDHLGRFVFDGIPARTYWLNLEHPDVAMLPPFPRTREVRLVPAETMQVRIGVPSAETLWRSNCPDMPPGSNAAVISGYVTIDYSGEPAAGAMVAAQAQRWRLLGRWPYYEVTEREVVTAVVGADGRYVFCGAEPDLPITLRAAQGEWHSRDVVVWGNQGQITRQDLVVLTRR